MSPRVDTTPAQLPSALHHASGALARLRLVFFVLVSSLLASGCSVVGTLYERLDLVLEREADRWLDLERDQKARFRAALEDSLARHRREELPAWIRLLREVAAQVERDPSATEILQTIDDARTLVDRTTALMTGPIARALAELKPLQVEHLARRMDEDNAEYDEEFLDPDPGERAQRRVERTREAIERWSGQLEEAQQRRVEGLMTDMPDGSSAWRDYRLAWQDALLGELRAGADADRFERVLIDWWVGDAGIDPAYAAQMLRNRELFADALTDLIASFSPAQRGRAADRLRDAADALEATLEPA